MAFVESTSCATCQDTGCVRDPNGFIGSDVRWCPECHGDSVPELAFTVVELKEAVAAERARLLSLVRAELGAESAWLPFCDDAVAAVEVGNRVTAIRHVLRVLEGG